MIKSTERQKLWLRQRETEVETSLLDIWLDVISGTVSALRLHKEDNFLDYCSRLSCNVTWLHLSSTLSCGKTDSSACLSSAIYHCKKIIPLYFSVCDVDKECRQGYDAGRAWSKKRLCSMWLYVDITGACLCNGGTFRNRGRRMLHVRVKQQTCVCMQ